jgi:trehalose/maltose hydrolase-like predicted phosphorylase
VKKDKKEIDVEKLAVSYGILKVSRPARFYKNADNASTYFNLKNSMSTTNCEINIIVYEPVTLDSLDLECKGHCIIHLNSRNLTINNMKITSDATLDINTVYLKVTNLDVSSTTGNYLFNYISLSGTAKLEN